MSRLLPSAPVVTCRRLLAAVAVLCWPLLLVPGAVGPAGAIAEVGLTSPVEGSRLEGAFEVVVRVRPDEGEVVQHVRASISQASISQESSQAGASGSSERTVDLTQDAEPDTDGSQVWRGTVDPADGIPLANGTHQIGIEAAPLLGEPRAAQGHDVQLAVPPPRRDLSANPSQVDATAVELAWQPVTLPDFVAYRVQRRPHDVDGPWATVHDLPDPRADGVVDAVSDPGTYRYRLIVVRSDGDGGELFATSAPQGVRADPDDPGTFPVPPEPDPRPSSTPAPAPSPDPDPDGASGSETPGPTESGTATGPPVPTGPVTVRPPPSAVAPPLAPPPAVVPFDDGVFEDLLPFEATESERIVIDSDIAVLDGEVRPGGTLAVLTEAPPDRGVMTAAAAGLLLVVAGVHIRRYLAGGGGR